MSVTKLTVPLDKIDFRKIDSRKVLHQTSHIHFRYMQDTFRIISSIEFEYSIFNCILNISICVIFGRMTVFCIHVTDSLMNIL
jgi:hypothetical protein